MATQIIDPNHWLQIYPSGSTTLAFKGTWLFMGANTSTPYGAIMLDVPDNPISPSFLWQIFPLNSTTYILRTKESGAKGFLNTNFDPNSTNFGGTVMNMKNSTIDNDGGGMLWNVGNWKDGSLWFSNVANGSEVLMSANDKGGVSMVKNTSATEQSWQVRQGDVINDSAFSFVLGMPVNTAAPTASSTAKTTPTNTGVPAASSTASDTRPPSHHSLSTGAAAAIGVSITVIAVMAITLTFYFFRRRKAKVSEMKMLPVSEAKAELDSRYKYGSELHNEPIKPRPVEMGAEREVAELGGREGYR